MERRGKSSPTAWEHCGAVNSIRSNTVEETYGLPDRLRGGGLSVPATVRLDRWLSMTEPGLQYRSQNKKLLRFAAASCFAKNARVVRQSMSAL